MALVALLTAVSSATHSAAAAPHVRVISDRVLAGAAAKAIDVRWASAGSVYVTTLAAGVLEIDPQSDKGQRIAFPTSRGNCSTCAHLAASSRYIVTAFEAFALAWKQVGDAPIHNAPFDSIVDIDVRDDRLLLLGSRREEGKWAPDGAIAWAGTLSKDLLDLHPVLFSTMGAEAQILGDCNFTGFGAARYLRDGSFILLPGVEPGVFLYGADGKLEYTWQTDGLGFVDRCDLSHEDRLLYARDPEARYQWLSRRRIVNDILPLPEGPALVVREVDGGRTKWTILVLRRNARPVRVGLPFTSPTDVASMRADVRGNRIAFLIRTFGGWRRGFTAPAARLIIAEWQ